MFVLRDWIYNGVTPGAKEWKETVQKQFLSPQNTVSSVAVPGMTVFWLEQASLHSSYLRWSDQNSLEHSFSKTRGPQSCI